MPSPEDLRDAALHMVRGLYRVVGSTERGHAAWQGMRFAYRSPLAAELHEAFEPLLRQAEELKDDVVEVAEALEAFADVVGHLEGVRDELAGRIDLLEDDINNEAFNLERAVAFVFDWRLVPKFWTESENIAHEQRQARAAYDQAVRECVARIDRVSEYTTDIDGTVGQGLDADEKAHALNHFGAEDGLFTAVTLFGPGRLLKLATKAPRPSEITGLRLTWEATQVRLNWRGRVILDGMTPAEKLDELIAQFQDGVALTT